MNNTRIKNNNIMNSSLNNNNIIIRHTHPGVFPQEVWERIAEEYTANVAPQITGAAMAMLEHAAKGPLSSDQIIEAIQLTGLAVRPSPLYLRKVLDNMAMEEFWLKP
jgi:hypothetical protein